MEVRNNKVGIYNLGGMELVEDIESSMSVSVM